MGDGTVHGGIFKSNFTAGKRREISSVAFGKVAVGNEILGNAFFRERCRAQLQRGKQKLHTGEVLRFYLDLPSKRSLNGVSRSLNCVSLLTILGGSGRGFGGLGRHISLLLSFSARSIFLLNSRRL